MKLTFKQSVMGLLLMISFGIGFWVRLRDIKAPLADWHSWRQADTAAVAREYVKNGIDLMHPRYQDISSMQSGKDNPNGYRMVEFPLVNGFVAFVYTSIPVLQQFEIHVVYRFVNIVLSLVSAYFIYKILSAVESQFTGVLAASVFLLLPYNIFYSRTILPEIAMVTTSMIAIWLCIKYLESKKIGYGITFTLSAAVALLIKPVAIFLLAPLIPYVISKVGTKIFTPKWILFAFLAIAPVLWWRWWISQFPEGIPASSWLLNGNGIRFKGAFFQWIFADRIGRIILGYWGLILLGLGTLAKKKSNLIFWWTVGSFAYLSVFATGNVQHDYYQIPLVPILSILIAYGIQFLRRLNASFLSKYSLLVIVLAFMWAFSWYHVRTLFAVNNPAIVNAGKAIERISNPQDLVVAPYSGDTAFLYQTNRSGWPIGGSIDDKIEKGADYYVATAKDSETQELMKKYRVVEETNDYVVIDLTP